MAVRPECRIVTEALVAARRELKFAIDAALESLDPSVRPREGEHADEVSAPRLRRPGGLQLLLDARHRTGEILRLMRPARRVDTRGAAERLDAKAGIICERRFARRARRRFGLQDRIVTEGQAGLFRFAQAERAGTDRMESEWRQKSLDLPQLAAIMRRRHDPRREAPAPGSGLGRRAHWAT